MPTWVFQRLHQPSLSQWHLQSLAATSNGPAYGVFLWVEGLIWAQASLPCRVTDWSGWSLDFFWLDKVGDGIRRGELLVVMFETRWSWIRWKVRKRKVEKKGEWETDRVRKGKIEEEMRRGSRGCFSITACSSSWERLVTDEHDPMIVHSTLLRTLTSTLC